MIYQNEIFNIIQKNMKLTETMETIGLDTELDNIGMDSIAFIKIIIEIEKKFNIEFPMDLLIISRANTIRKLCEIVRSSKAELDK